MTRRNDLRLDASLFPCWSIKADVQNDYLSCPGFPACPPCPCDLCQPINID